MKCEEIQDVLVIYWDLPSHDTRRKEVDAHIEQCAACHEEFHIWKESTELIRSTIHEAKHPVKPASLSQKVMDRIYENEAWRMPIPDRIYAISYKLRRNLTAVIAMCLAMFMFSFLYSLVYEAPVEDSMASESISFGLQPVAAASGDMKASTINTAKLTASISPQDPFKFKAGTFDSVPDYMLVLSLLGLIFTLLIMNWLSRIKN